MIFSLLVRNYKVYRGWSYIPLSQNVPFTALVGENGIGKSSILEALDTYFNKPSSEWNYNHSISKSGFDRAPEICPIFLIEKNKVNKSRNVYKYLEVISSIMWQFEQADYASAHKEICVQIEKHISNTLDKNKNIDIDKDFFLFPVGIRKKTISNTELTFSIFEHNSSLEDDLLNEFGQSLEDVVSEIGSFIRDEFNYILIPSEIDYETYTKIEGRSIQSLMGTTIDEIIKSLIDEKVIKSINSGLDKFLNKIQERLENYEYKKPAQRQTLFNLSHLTDKIIETYFESKVLNLKDEGSLTPISNCSSGEKRKAIIDLAHAFILDSERKSKYQFNVVAVDEPEASLHTSSCFSQFEKLEDIACHNVQTIISTHWYGFFPSVSKGSAVLISGSSREKKSHLIDLTRFREDIKQLTRETKGKIPDNIELKSINDVVQAVVSSVTRTKSNWIICEGVSDKIYLTEFFKHRDDVFVISIGGSKYVKKFYEYVYLALDDNRDNIIGKILLILDTDKSFERYQDKSSIKKVEIKRLQNVIKDNRTFLFNTTDNNFYPPTEIEDVLHPKAFVDTLKYFRSNGFESELELVLDGITKYDENLPSGLAFDFRLSDKEKIEQFFNIPGVKVNFAKHYVKLVDDIPEWIRDIEAFFDK